MHNNNDLEKHPLRYVPEYHAVLDNLTQLCQKMSERCNLSTRYDPILKHAARLIAFELNCLKGMSGFILPYQLPWFNMASYDPLLKTGAATTCTATISLTVKLLYVAFSRCKKKLPSTINYSDLFLGFLQELIGGGVYLYGYYLSKDLIDEFDDDFSGLAFSVMASIASVIIGQQAVAIPTQLFKRFQDVYKKCHQPSVLPITDAPRSSEANADDAPLLPAKNPSGSNSPQSIRSDYKEISQQDSLYLLQLTGLFLFARFDHSDRRAISTWKNEYLSSFIFALISYVITLIYHG